MRIQEFTTAQGLPGEIEYPDAVCFLSSPQPLRIRISASADEIPDNLAVSLTVDGGDGRSMTEEREFSYDALVGELSVEFDTARMMQLCSQHSPEDVLHMVQYRFDHGFKSGNPVESFVVAVAWDGYDAELSVSGIHGAYDPGDQRQGDRQVRLFVNYPQTVQLNGGDPDEVGNDTFYDSPAGYPGNLVLGESFREVPVLAAIADVDADHAAEIRAGAPFHGHYYTPFLYQRGEMIQVPSSSHRLDLIPDTRTRGLYLRWLGRDGAVGYWLFQTSQKTTTGADTTAFDRFVFNPSIPAGGVYKNSRMANRSLVRTVTAGDAGLSAAEMDLLSGLAASPVVEMLVDNTPGSYLWQQVTLSAVTVKQQDDSEGPKLGEVEVVVILPELNTVKH